jgi:hypothetical protein
MKKKDRYRTCRHIKANGLRCESPALRGGYFCYYHSKLHTIGAEPYAKYGSLQLPAPEDKAAIQLSIARISDAVVNGRIDLRRAASLFRGLQIASQFIDRKKDYFAPEPIRSAEQTPDGEELAPDVFVCGKNDKCEKCPLRDSCNKAVFLDENADEPTSDIEENEAESEASDAGPAGNPDDETNEESGQAENCDDAEETNSIEITVDGGENAEDSNTVEDTVDAAHNAEEFGTEPVGNPDDETNEESGPTENNQEPGESGPAGAFPICHPEIATTASESAQNRLSS